jgi:hypothetical protein
LQPKIGGARFTKRGGRIHGRAGGELQGSHVEAAPGAQRSFGVRGSRPGGRGGGDQSPSQRRWSEEGQRRGDGGGGTKLLWSRASPGERVSE